MIVLITLAMARRLVMAPRNSFRVADTMETFERGLLEADYSAPLVYLSMVDCKVGYNDYHESFYIYDYEPSNTEKFGVAAAFHNAGLAMPINVVTV